MTDLLERLEAAIDQRARAIEGSGFLGWLTFRFADGSMHYTAAAGSQPLDEPHWFVDGKEATGYTSARVVYDEKREWRRVARDRKLLELHTPRSHHQRAFVEEGSRQDPAVAYEPTGALCWTACPSCGGSDWDIERFDVLEPCDTLRLLAEDYEIEVQS